MPSIKLKKNIGNFSVYVNKFMLAKSLMVRIGVMTSHKGDIVFFYYVVFG